MEKISGVDPTVISFSELEAMATNNRLEMARTIVKQARAEFVRVLNNIEQIDSNESTFDPAAWAAEKDRLTSLITQYDAFLERYGNT